MIDHLLRQGRRLDQFDLTFNRGGIRANARNDFVVGHARLARIDQHDGRCLVAIGQSGEKDAGNQDRGQGAGHHELCAPSQHQPEAGAVVRTRTGSRLRIVVQRGQPVGVWCQHSIAFRREEGHPLNSIIQAFISNFKQSES